jgi:hypothetical protein
MTPSCSQIRPQKGSGTARIAAVAVLILVLASCDQADGTADPEGSESASSEAGPVENARALIYLEEGRLVTLDLESEDVHRSTELPSSDIALSPDTERFVVVEETSPLGPGPEGFRQPRLVLGSTEDQPSEPLGPGRSPLWSPDGGLVAAIAPSTKPGDCPKVETEGSGCLQEQVVVYDPSSPGTVEIVTDPAAGYSLLGWAGDEVLSLRPPGEAVLGNTPIPIPTSELWGVSPRGNDVLIVDDAGSSFSSIDAEAPYARIVIDGRLGDGSWSPNGDWVSAVVLTPAGTKLSSILTLIDSQTGEATRVSAGEGAQGQVVWQKDSARFAFARINPDQPRKLQAVECTIELECRSLFSWVQGVTLLGIR